MDPLLTAGENKEILKSIMFSPITEFESGELYEQAKAMLEEQVRTKYPEIIEPLEEKIIELERTEKTSKRRYKKIKALELQLSETEKLLEEERAKPPEVAPIKVRVLRPFTEGILDYTVGSVVETKDLGWVLEKINRGLVERVGIEVPVKRVPPPVPAIPKHKYLADTEVERLWQEFVAYASLKTVPEPGLYRERFMSEIKTARDYEVASRRGRILVDAIIKELRPPPVRPPPDRVVRRPPEKIALPPGWKKVMNGYVTPMGEFVSEAEYPALMRKMLPHLRFVPPAKPPGLSLKNWLLWQHGLGWGDFLKLGDYERKTLQDEYVRLSRIG
ncbi:hypothetical protein ES702_00395 [subsurface metagenome]